MPTYTPSGSALPPGPPRPGVPTVLKVLIAVVLFGCVAGAVLYGIFVSRLIARLRPATPPHSVAKRQPPFAGPDPWKPRNAPDGGPATYRMDIAGFALSLPAPPIAETVAYSSEDASRVSRYFNYHFSPGGRPVYGFLHGLQYPSGFPSTVDAAGDTFERGYRSIPAYANVQFTRKRSILKGRPVLDLSGTFRYDGDLWYVEGIAFVGGSYSVSIGVSSRSPQGLAGLSKQIGSSVQWFEPQNPAP